MPQLAAHIAGGQRPAAPPIPPERTAHEVDFTIEGTEIQYVEVELDPGESAVAEAGAMMYMTGGIGMALAVPIMAGFVLYYGRAVLKKQRYWALVGVGIGLVISGSNAVHLHEFYFDFLSFIAGISFVIVVVFAFLRNNLLAYALLGFASVRSTVENLGQLSAPAYQIQAGVLLFLALLLIFYLWWRTGNEHGSAPP